MKLIPENCEVENAIGVSNVKKICPLCQKEVTFDEVYFNLVASVNHNGHEVFIEMLDPYYYRMW